MIGRFADRWLNLLFGMAAGTGGVLMGPVDSGVHRHCPLDQPDLVGHRLQRDLDGSPSAGQLPGAEQPVDALPRAVALGHVPPRAPGAGAEADAVDQLSQRPTTRSARPWPAREQRRQDQPLLVGQVVAGTGR
jgi:hypothetical protein